jgi:rubrerythrin
MNPFDFALKMERDGELFYLRLADESPSPGFASIFALLARAEALHYDIVLRLQQAQTVQVGDSPILDDAKNIFQALQGADRAFFLDPNRTDPFVHQYRRAQEIERQSSAFYRAKAASAAAAVADAFRQLAGEEDRHYWILHNIIEHVGRPDFGWIEFAEWHHRDKY